MTGSSAAVIGHALDDLAGVARDFCIPSDMSEKRTRWLLGRVQVAQVELEGLEARLIAHAVNNTPQPKTPATPRPTPKPGTTAPKPKPGGTAPPKGK